jgi:ACT domain-containing protein
MRTPAILSVLGEDRVGIVARISGVLAESHANIEDIRQTIIGGIFSMTMLVTIDEEVTAIDELQSHLTEVGTELGLQITLQREDVFRFMHRI